MQWLRAANSQWGISRTKTELQTVPDSIFSTYRNGENRITASLLAVLRSLDLQRTERLLGALMERKKSGLGAFEAQCIPTDAALLEVAAYKTFIGGAAEARRRASKRVSRGCTAMMRRIMRTQGASASVRRPS
jgi:hypothetical protein